MTWATDAMDRYINWHCANRTKCRKRMSLTAMMVGVALAVVVTLCVRGV